MKKIMLAVILSAIGQAASLAAGLALLYPLGGENLPINGKHTITWTNSADLPVHLYLDWYDTNEVLLVSNNLLYTNTLPAGTNSFVLHYPSGYPLEHKYKVRLENDTNNITSSSGFVRITSPATFTAQITNQNQWLPNQTRNITVSWDGFLSNDAYSIILESPQLGIEGYGFLITNVVTGSETGTQTFAVPYPFTTVPAYPPFSNNLSDGKHLFTILNKRCDIVTTFGSIDMVTAGLRMYLGPGTNNYILRGQSGICSSVFLDTTLATNTVHVSSISIVFTSYSTNWVSMTCVLKDSSQVISTNSLNFVPSTNNQYHVQVAFPVDLNLQAGQIKELVIECSVNYTSGVGDFIWDTGGISTNIFGGISATYIGGAPINTKVIPSSGTYVNILEIINPKFITSGTQSNAVVFGVFCKPSTAYEVQTSTNLVNWTTFLTTNSVNDTMYLAIPITNGNHFFRLREN